MPAKFFSLDPTLQTQLEALLETTWNTFPDLALNQIALTWVAYEPPYTVNTGGSLSTEEFWKHRPQGASYRGVELMEPGCIAHLFYLVALHDWLEQGMVPGSAEIERAITDMMAATNHDAASFVVDILSGTTSGPSLPPGPDETWASQRDIVNRYFANLGWPELRSINLNQKTWRDRPYGREQDFLGKALENRNQLTTEATARLLHGIVGGVSVSAQRSQKMMGLLKRSHLPAYFPARTQLWSSTSVSETGSHSVAYVEAQSVHPYLLAIFTQPENRLRHTEQLSPQADSEAVIAFIAEQIFQASQQNFEKTR
ncbi:MAG: serine hydrolase [Phormidesmis sp.]